MRFRTIVVSAAAIGLAAAAGRTAVEPPAPPAAFSPPPTLPADTAATRLVLGCDTEIFTAALVAQLVQSGRLSLDDRLGTLLPWYRQDTGALVTVGHLLAHTSGIPDHRDLAAGADAWPGASTRGIVRAWCSGDLTAAPGTRHHDGAADGILLGAIIEAVSGDSYAGAVRALVMPAGVEPARGGTVAGEPVCGRAAEGGPPTEGPPPVGEAALDVSILRSN